MATENIELKFSTAGAQSAAAQASRVGQGFRSLGASSLAASAKMKTMAAASATLSKALSLAKYGALAAAAGFAAVGGVGVAGIKKALNEGARLHKLASSLGEDAGKVALLSQAFAENGLSADAAGTMITKMQRKVAEGSDAFKTLGLSAEDLKGKNAAKQMEIIGEAVRGLTSQESKMKALMQLFEEAGPQLMQFFNNPKALEDASKTLGTSVSIMSKNAAAFERASTLIGNIGIKIRTFFEGVAQGIVGPLTAVLEAFNNVDLAAIGQEFGDKLAYGVEVLTSAFKQDRLGELVNASLSYGFMKAGNVFLKLPGLFGDALRGVLEDIFVWLPVHFFRNVLDLLQAFFMGLYGQVTSLVLSKSELEQWFTQKSLNAISRQEKREKDLFNVNIGFSQKDIANAGARLKDIAESLVPSWVAPSARQQDPIELKVQKIDIPEFKTPVIETAASQMSRAEISTDSLRRVGGFIGSTSLPGSTMDYARKTATSSERTARAATGINDVSQRILKAVESRSVATFA